MFLGRFPEDKLSVLHRRWPLCPPRSLACFAPSTNGIVIVGAGPYGLSVAAHLRRHGLPFRIFGSPMQSWRSSMPTGMLLKSEGCASSLSDPAGSYTLKAHL
jgi:hypothetical protein